MAKRCCTNRVRDVRLSALPALLSERVCLIYLPQGFPRNGSCGKDVSAGSLFWNVINPKSQPCKKGGREAWKAAKKVVSSKR